MSNALFFNLVVLISIGIISYALLIQYRNKNSVQSVIEGALDDNSTLYYGNLAYCSFLQKRISLLKYALSALSALFILGLINQEFFNANHSKFNSEIVTLFFLIWGLFISTLLLEFFLIQRYRDKSIIQSTIETMTTNFKVARFFYAYMNKLINLVSLSCLSLLIVMF